MADMNIDQRAHTQKVLNEVLGERYAQHSKWGEQNHPSFPQELYRPQEVDRVRLEGRHVADEARSDCEQAFNENRGSYAHIFNEELAEAYAEFEDEAKLRAELVQVAAVTVAWIEAIDRRQKAS